MKLLSSILLLSLLMLPLHAETKPAHNPANWENAIHAFEDADKASPPPQGAIVFTGASGITRWKTLKEDFPEYPVINRGFGGSRMDDLLYYTDRVVLAYKPRLIVVQTGGNDINQGRTPEEVAKDFFSFVEKVQKALPETRIAFFEQSPSPARWAQAESQQKLNQLVQDFIAKGKNLVFIKTWNSFIGPDGKPREDLFVEDKLHNNEAGYKICVQLVKPFLDGK